jgi:putative endonuclease
MRKYFVYILTSKNHTVLYTGFTDDLERRVFQHKNRIWKGFTSKYNVDKLVYYEEFSELESAKARETQLKKHKRSWKVYLINEKNPEWRDLYKDFERM